MKRNTQAVFNGLGSFGIVGYSQDELQTIHLATMDVLRNVGVRVDSKEARDIFAAGGCIVDEATNIVKIPSYVVEDAIHTAPSTIQLCGRNPENDYIVEKNRVGFVNFGEGVMVRDPETFDYREESRFDERLSPQHGHYLQSRCISGSSRPLPGSA